jgi:hypothetical protein
MITSVRSAWCFATLIEGREWVWMKGGKGRGIPEVAPFCTGMITVDNVEEV